MRSIHLVAIAVAAAALALTAGSASAALPERVTLDGIGGVRPGMSAAEASRRWGIPVRPTGPRGCQRAALRDGGRAAYAIFVGGRFAAAIFRKAVATDTGIRIGSTLAQLRRAYGRRISSRPNKYTPGARDLFVRRTRSPRWELRFDLSPKGRVTVIAFGRSEIVRLVEGCS